MAKKAEPKLVEIEKSDTFKVGVCSVQAYIQNKELTKDFLDGKKIKVDPGVKAQLAKLNWIKKKLKE